MSERLAPLGAPVQAAALASAAGLVALAATRSLWGALALALIPVMILLLSRPVVAAIIGVGTLPLASEAASGNGVQISLPDLLMVMAVLGSAVMLQRSDASRLKPLLPLVASYAGIVFLALAAHVSAASVFGASQRLELLLVPLTVGGVLLSPRRLQQALAFYLLTATALALAWGLHVLPESSGFQKNPVGQFITVALLLITAYPGQRWRFLLVPALAWGLFQTQSRGAILALLIGLLVLFVARPGIDRLRTGALLVPLLAVLGLVYLSLPDDVQYRTTTLSSNGTGDPTSAEYTIRIRETFRADALHIIRNHPVTGVGIGNYRAGVATQGSLTNDPHNVLLLEAAEGGLPLLGALLVLLVGSFWLVWRRRRDTPLAPVALAVQASIISHGLVDIYWVRGTPVLGWLLVGAALTDAHRRSAQA